MEWQTIVGKIGTRRRSTESVWHAGDLDLDFTYLINVQLYGCRHQPKLIATPLPIGL